MGMKRRCCHYCGQPLPEVRLGVKLPPLKARIFDLILRSGKDGISREDVHSIAFEGRAENPNIVSVHITQINDLLEETSYKIVGGGFYRLVSRDHTDHYP